MILTHHPWGWWTFFAAAISDALDGYLARLLGVQSELGLYLDPLADKLYVTAVTIAWAAEGRFPLWVLALVLSRDAFILGGSAVIYRKTGRRDFQPSLWGKLSTIFQLCALGACFLLSDAALQRWLWACTAATLFSGFDYARIGWAMWKRG